MTSAIRLPSLRLLSGLSLTLVTACVISFYLPFALQRQVSATLVVLSYLSFCLFIRIRHKEKESTALAGFSADTQQFDTHSILIAYASQTGYAEQIAIKTAQHLQTAGLAVAVSSLDRIKSESLQQSRRILFVVSTTGEGDAPDNAAAFTRRIMTQSMDLSQLSFAVLALGDRHYQHFCAFGHRLATWLRHQNAHGLFDMVEVDNGDESDLRRWQHHLGVVSGHTEISDWSRPAYQSWILTERELLNPGSVGGPAYRISCVPAEGEMVWQAGDIAEIGPQYQDQGRNEEIRPPLPHREYSISSVPEDGKLELLVRQMRRPDGSLGIGSGWLTAYAAIGQPLALRIRENRNFHTPQHDCPLILIGNGTGLAGLRAHIKTRAAKKQLQNWLFFGERQAAHDYFHQKEIENWFNSTVLTRLDLCFSRDQPERRYVQHALQERSAEIRDWVAQGAAILVCGSLQGMAEDVHTTLSAILTEDKLEQMAENHLYQRDVY